MENPFAPYMKKFSERKLWGTLRKYARRLGIQAVYSMLLLLHAYRRPDTPRWAKNIVLGVLGYVISPIDAIPDLTPILGYTDDIGMLSFGVVTIAAYINEEVRTKAKKQLKDWFGDYDAKELQEIDEQL
ncbi:MAG TPA: YkvA family protein [Saprospiraceae bacterium]|nr:YkvA family protein [Saprospiraceae bacterium]HMP23462.1 YkvA family protein [Saprospiraceae bacterium]